MNPSNDTPPLNFLSVLGADISSLQRAQELGARYFYENGMPGNPIMILKEIGRAHV
jgi:arabinogalactan endo-1,4-beta-galactosidase